MPFIYVSKVCKFLRIIFFIVDNLKRSRYLGNDYQITFAYSDKIFYYTNQDQNKLINLIYEIVLYFL